MEYGGSFGEGGRLIFFKGGKEWIFEKHKGSLLFVEVN
jgi:hypothetical protein